MSKTIKTLKIHLQIKLSLNYFESLVSRYLAIECLNLRLIIILKNKKQSLIKITLPHQFS
jgi:hypothetical protein